MDDGRRVLSTQHWSQAATSDESEMVAGFEGTGMWMPAI
jgi:hypothetical protein